MTTPNPNPQSNTIDFPMTAVPPPPGANTLRLFADSVTGYLTAIDTTGQSAFPPFTLPSNIDGGTY
jgi:hypothetical protein